MVAKHRSPTLGFATIELVLAGVVVISIIIGGFAVSTYLSQSIEVGRLSEIVREVPLRPLRVQDDGRLGVDTVALDTAVASIRDRIRDEALTITAGGVPADPSQIYVDVGYSILAIDPFTGALEPQVPTVGLTESYGALPLAHFIRHVPTQASLLQNFVTANSQVPFLYASPSGNFTPGSTSVRQYLPFSFAIIVRIVFEPEENGFSEWVREELSGSGILGETRVFGVRGQIQ